MEIIEEIRPIPREIIEEIRGAIDAQEQETDGRDSPLSPLAMGFVPPYTGLITPDSTPVDFMVQIIKNRFSINKPYNSN